MNRHHRKEQARLQIDKDLQDGTNSVLVQEDKYGRWDVRCYTQRSFGGRDEYIGGTSSIADFDTAHKLAKFYAPVPEAITVRVGR